MSPIRTNEIIDLCSSSPSSSPSPIRVRTRSQSRARCLAPEDSAGTSKASGSGKNAAATVNSNGRKWKGKQPLRSLGPVIELTDSEDEKEDDKALAPTGTERRQDQPSSSSSGAASDSRNASGSSLDDEQATRNAIPDLNSDPPRVSVLDLGKGKGREILVEEVNVGASNVVKDLWRDGEPVVTDDDYIKPSNADTLEARRSPIAGPSDQPAAVVAPALPPPVPIDLVAPPDPEPLPGPVADPPTQALARILEVVPSVDPEFLYPLIATHLPNFGEDPTRTAEFLIGAIFEMGDKVPKVKSNVKGKRKSEAREDAGSSRDEEKAQDGSDDERKGKKAKVDWASVDRPFRGTGKYFDLALIYLQTSFPRAPKRYLRRQLTLHNGHYAPTHLSLLANEEAQREEYERKVTRYNPEKDRAKLAAWKDPLLEEERAWVVEKEQDENLVEEGDKQDKGKGKAKAVDRGDDEEPELEDGEGIECQCCFCEYPFANMVQCPEAHLFCTTCISQYASTQLGSHCATLVCMHPSECKQPFPESELRRVLDSKLMDLYNRVKQQKEIEDAGLEDLEECPFCEWKCVIEVSKEEEKLFRCGNEDGGCGVVSCRMCKKEDHLPKSCKEVEEDKHLDSQHAIEEAMTQALMRQCPKCKKPFIKDAGCNKMSCPHCRTVSCYICREIINGYDHFNQAPPSAPSGSRENGKCILWDSVEQRHADEVKAAAEKALAEFKKNHPDADPSGIKVDIPKAPPAPAVPAGVNYHIPFNQNVNNNNQFNIAAMNAHQARIQQMGQAQAAGMWGAMYMPPGIPIAGQPPAPVPAVLPPAPVVGRRPRGPALVAQARRGRRRGPANPDGPRIANHAANVRADPAPIPQRRATRDLEVPPAPAHQNVLPHFHFGGLGGGIVPQQPLYGANANVDAMQQQQQQRFREVVDMNQRLQNNMARLRDDQARLNEWRGGVGDAGAAAANPASMDDERNQLEQRLLEAQQKVLRERMALMQGQHRHMMGNMEPLRMYQAERQGDVRGLPAMGYNAPLGMQMVPQDYGGHQHLARK